MQNNDYIFEVYREKSFTKAANKLFISQPALSAAIKKIEKNIGHELFDRSSNPIKLTEAGEIYIKSIEEIHMIQNNLTNKLNDISDLKTGKVSVSGANFMSSYVIPEIIKNFSSIYPGITIEFFESNSSALQENLLDEKIDLLIDYIHDENKFTSYPLLLEQILIAVPKGFAINEKMFNYALTCEDIKNGKHLSENCCLVLLKQFMDEKFISLKKGNDMYNQAHVMFCEAGINPKKIIYLDQLMTSYKFTEAGMGISFVTDTLIKSADEKGNVIFYKPKSLFSERTIYLSHKKGRYLKKAVTAFINTAKELYKYSNN